MKMERSDVLDVMVMSTAIFAGEKAMEMNRDRNEDTELYCTTKGDLLRLPPESNHLGTNDTLYFEVNLNIWPL